MFTKNIKDFFSDDLLNTVRSVVNEEKKKKHEKNCGCDECEEDEMKEGFASAAQRKAVWATYADGGKGHPDKKKKMKKEGYVPTADEPSDHDKKMAQKVRDLLAKEKKPKPVKEAAERQISRDEYHRAGGNNNRLQYTTGDEKNKKYWTRTPKNEEVELEEGKMKELVTKHMDAGHDYNAALKKAKKDLEKMKNEEVEQIDELSKKTLGSYVKKAGVNAATAGMALQHATSAGPSAKKELDAASKRMTKRIVGIGKAADKLTKEEQEFIDALNNDMFEEIEIAEANLKVGDYTATAEKSKFHKKGYRPHLKNPQGKTSYLAGVAYKTPEHAAGEAAAYHKGYTSGPGRASERGADDAVRAYRHKNKEHMHEEVDLEEADAWHVKLNGKRVSKHFDSEDRAKKFAEYGSSTQKGKFTVHKSMAEDVELEEGRGRPPKEGSAAWKARQKQADDDMVALGMQLRKARSINKKVRFMDGKEHDIHPNHINRFDDHMAARRTSQEKAAFQKQAHKSHADFVKAVSAPVPKASKDTGEIVKYR